MTNSNNLFYKKTDGDSISTLANSIEAKTILEIGCCEGVMAAWLLDKTGLVTLLGIDICLKRQPVLMQQAHLGRYFLLEGDSRELYKHLRGWKFDLIYVDGGHSEEIVKNDLENYYPLLREGGIMCGDDYTYITFDDGEICGVIQAVDKFIVKHEKTLYITHQEFGSKEPLGHTRQHDRTQCRWYFIK